MGNRQTSRLPQRQDAYPFEQDRQAPQASSWSRSPGGQHHHRTNMDKYHPGYFGKVGMRYFHKQGSHFWKPVINLDKLWSLIPAEKRDEYLVSKKGDTIPVLDLLPLGYSKVLGKGRLPEVPLVVRARWFSKEAERKITEAGGVVELVA